MCGGRPTAGVVEQTGRQGVVGEENEEVGQVRSGRIL